MQYRLLRNNKESGPYTTNQLLEMGLKPYDLLWADGKAASWQYASEIDELKAIAPVVEEQPYDRFLKKTDQHNPVNGQKTKPRFRISAGKIVMVEEPADRPSETIFKEERLKTVAAQQNANKSTVKAAKPGWQEMYSEWKKPETSEETPEIISEKTPEIISEEKPEVVVTEKYSQSLDDLKKQYEEKVLGQRAEKHESSAATRKQNIMAAVAIVVLALGSFAGYKLKQSGDKATITEQAAPPPVERAEIAGDKAIAGEQKTLTTGAVNTSSDAQNISPVAVSTDVNKEKKITSAKNSNELSEKRNEVSPLTSNEVVKKKGNSEKENSTLVKAPVKQQESTAPVKKTTVDVIEKDKKQSEIKIVTANNSTSSKNNDAVTTDNALPPAKPAVKTPAKKRISDYIALRKSASSVSATSVQNVHLSVENTSDFAIDLAVIDIQYYDQHGKYQKGETMYVKNISSGDNVDVRVPDSRNSKSVTYKVSMVSAEQKTLYLVGD